jgi:hypothetical protein
VLDGRAGCVVGPPPRKSNPNRESFAFVCFGGAASVFGGAPRIPTGGPVLGRGGAGVSSPNRSMVVWGACGLACGGGGWLELEPRRCDADRSNCTFSCTFLRGCLSLAPFFESPILPLTISSSSASRVEGSGMGPSIVHRFDSYFVRMKFSIFASDGTWPGASLASQYLFARAFPHFSTLCNCSSVHVSRSTDLTLLMCVPIPRCMPEQRMHMKTPRFQLAHRGSVAVVSTCLEW